jgi:tetratricopeptide (TPR) repeat protein
MKNLQIQLIFYARIAIVISGLLGCSYSPVNPDAPDSNTLLDYSLAKTRPSIRQATSSILSGNGERANAALNTLLNSSPRDPLANLLNGVAYQSQANGEDMLWDLAKIGYQLAEQFDPYLWQAPYLSGFMLLKEKKLSEAINAFLRAALTNPENATPLYGLALANYVKGDVRTAYQVVTQALQLDHNHPLPQHQRIAVLCLAAAGAFDSAQQQLTTLKANQHEIETAWLEQKLTKWHKIYANPEALPALSGIPLPAVTPAVINGKSARMAVLEAVFIRSTIVKQSRYGINLLDGLTTQFNGSIVNSGDSTKTSNSSSSSPDVTTTLVNALKSSNLYSLTIPAITYSLNIANSVVNQSHILAHPTVIALDGKPSKFFVGNETSIYMSGSFSSAAFNKEIGLSVQVTPTFLTDDTAELTAEISLSTLRDAPSGGISSSHALLTAKASNNTSAVLRMGQTLAVNTTTIHDEEDSQSGVPLLGDLPLVNTFFSSRNTGITDRSLLVLLTLKGNPNADKGVSSSETGVINTALLGRLKQTFPTIEPAVEENLKKIEQRDVLTVIRPQDAATLMPLWTEAENEATQNWQKQFMTQLLSGQ